LGFVESVYKADWAQIVVEQLSKNVNEGHLREIFGKYGPIRNLSLPMNPVCRYTPSFALLLLAKCSVAVLSLRLCVLACPFLAIVILSTTKHKDYILTKQSTSTAAPPTSCTKKSTTPSAQSQKCTKPSSTAQKSSSPSSSPAAASPAPHHLYTLALRPEAVETSTTSGPEARQVATARRQWAWVEDPGDHVIARGRPEVSEDEGEEGEGAVVEEGTLSIVRDGR
jgi:hypothetical protein